jgi:predicted nucleic acid-binding protein
MPAGISDKLIISDTSCLIAFANIGRFDLLQAVCRTITVTTEVAAEYKDPLPDWIQVMSVRDVAKTKSINMILGLGESSAIALALEFENVLVILDDKKARRYARSIGLEFIGIIGVLSQAYHKGLIDDLNEIVLKLRMIDFRIPPDTECLIREYGSP